MTELTDIEEKVLKEIKTKKQNLQKLSKKLKSPEKELKKILTKLEQELLIKELDGVYSYTLDDTHQIGVLKITRRGSGIVKISEEELYFINKEDLNNAIEGDTVLINFFIPMSNQAIVEAKKEEEKKLVGTVYIENNKYFVKADNPLFEAKLKLVKPPENIHNNDKVYVTFNSKRDSASYEITEIEILGNKYSLGVDITSIIKELGITEEFTEEELIEANKVKSFITEEDIKDRVDLQEEKIFTIDGKDSNDFDDAIGITVLPNNNLLVKVCIADVDHYIKENSLLDQTAINRTSSIYLIDRTIPMLPPIISNGICSLNPNEPRLTMTYEMEYDKDGNLLRYEIYPSIICSKQRMNYEDVDDVLTNPRSEKYLEYQEDLRLLEVLRKKILKKRIELGYSTWNDEERKIDYDKEQGKIRNIASSKRLKSSLLIEEYMIATNICASLFAKEHNIPIIYRVQKDEQKNDLEKKLQKLERMGFKKFEFKDNASNNELIREILSYYKDDPNLPYIKRILTNYNRAYYTDDKTYHSNLNEKNYAHFTSPIRRYPDLYSSRQLKKYLRKAKSEKELLKETLEYINEKSSDIKMCCLRVEGLKLGEYYHEQKENMTATIIDISPKSITIQLDDLTTGKIFNSNLQDYYFDFDDYSFKSYFSLETLKVGDKIQVKLKDIDQYKGQINYKIYQK